MDTSYLITSIMSALQTEKGSRPCCRNQERRRGSDEVVQGTSVFPLSESGMSRNFWGRIKGAKYRFALQDGTWDFSWDAVADKGPHLAMTREARGFLELRWDSRVTTGNSGFLLCWPRKSNLPFEACLCSGSEGCQGLVGTKNAASPCQRDIHLELSSLMAFPMPVGFHREVCWASRSLAPWYWGALEFK